MTLNEYQELAMRTAPSTPTYSESLKLACLGLAGETGEFCDTMKKMFYHGHSPDIAALVEELGDILWYVTYATEVLGITLDAVAALNIAKLRRRYPDGFSNERSINRED